MLLDCRAITQTRSHSATGRRKLQNETVPRLRVKPVLHSDRTYCHVNQSCDENSFLRVVRVSWPARHCAAWRHWRANPIAANAIQKHDLMLTINLDQTSCQARSEKATLREARRGASRKQYMYERLRTGTTRDACLLSQPVTSTHELNTTRVLSTKKLQLLSGPAALK